MDRYSVGPFTIASRSCQHALRLPNYGLKLSAPARVLRYSHAGDGGRRSLSLIRWADGSNGPKNLGINRGRYRRRITEHEIGVHLVLNDRRMAGGT